MATTATRTRAALDNMVSVIEGTTPDNSWLDRKQFTHCPKVASLEQLRTASDASRAFIVDVTGNRALDGDMLQAREPGTVTQVFDVSILYPHNDNNWDLLRVIVEDVDRLSYRLMLASLWDANNTGIWRRRVDGYQLDFGDGGGAGDVATLVLPVETQYRPTF